MLGKLKVMKLLESSSEVRKFADDFMRTHDEAEKNEKELTKGRAGKINDVDIHETIKSPKASRQKNVYLREP